MPRNASGTYTLPSGNPVVSGTLIDATWANNTLSDLGNEVTDSLSRSGEGAMLAPLRITDGVQATPSLAFSNEPSSGLYRAGSNEWWAVAAGVQNLRFTNTGLTTRAAAGAVGTPSLAAFNDTDTGIYFPGANQLAIATGGVGALWVDSSQNVGVGTSSPAYKFHVERPSYGITGYFYANDGTRNPRLVVYGSSSGTTIQHTFSTGADSLIFAVGGSIGTGTEVARFVDGGNFGIGTASPGYRLDVRGTSTDLFQVKSTGAYTFSRFQSSSRNWALSIGSGFSIYDETAAASRLDIDSSGNVGIGTASPVYPLVVSAGGAQGLEFSPTALASAPLIQSYNRSGAAYTQLSFDASLYVFRISGTEQMRITNAGNIVAGASVALATTATDGFLYVPTCAGTPTGTPTAITGMAPIVVNTTNNKLYFYSGGVWRDAGP